MDDFEPALSVENVSKSFPVSEAGGQTGDGKFRALEDVSFSVKKGECALIAGANGSGKSLLMLIIAGLESAGSGRVKTGGRVGLVFQNADSQILGETPREDVATGLKNLKTGKKELATNADKFLDNVGLLDKAEFPSRFLSGGEKRRLSVAGILALDSSIIIFDEPFANLDYGGVVQVNTLIRKLKDEGKTVLILTHEIEKCLALTDRFIVLFCGKKVFDGTPEAGLKEDLERFGIRNPLCAYSGLEDLVWDGGR